MSGIEPTTQSCDNLGWSGSMDTSLDPEDDYIIISDKNHLRRCSGRCGGLDEAIADHSEAFVEYCGAQIAEAFDSATFDMLARNTSIGSSTRLPSRRSAAHGGDAYR